MAKFFGKLGFMETVETEPGIWEEHIIERDYYGDILQITRRWNSSSDQENDNISVDNKFSIVVDSFAYEHLHGLRYIEWFGTRWKVKTVEVDYPRLSVYIGGVYNGDDAVVQSGTSSGFC